MIEFTHSIRLDVVCNINVGFHCLVVAMSRPLHHHLRRNAQSEDVTDERSATDVRAKQGIFRRNIISSLKTDIDIVASSIAYLFYVIDISRKVVVMVDKGIHLWQS